MRLLAQAPPRAAGPAAACGMCTPCGLLLPALPPLSYHAALPTPAQGTDGPWVGNLASVLCGSPHIYVAEPGEQDW